MIYNDSKYNSDWDVKSLYQLGVFTRGKSKHRPRNDTRLFVDGKYPLIQTGEIKAANLFIRNHTDMYNDFGLKQSKLWPKNTLCITIAANIAETALLGYPMCFPDSVVGFNAFPKESSEIFMHYVFTYIKRAIQNTASGSIQDNINVDFLTTLNFKVPIKKYQDKIVEILSSLDSKIELNNRINAELEAMAKTLYDYWIVQFDFPNKKGKPYKTSGGKMVWNEELKRELPEGWSTIFIGNLLDSETSKPKIPTSEMSSKGEFPVIDQSADFIAGFTNNEDSIINTNLPRIIFGDHTRILKFINFNFARGADGTQVLFSSNKRMPQHLFYHTLLKIDLSNYGYARHFKFLKETRIILPNETIAQKFDETIRNNYLLIRDNIFQNQKLSELRDWLLPMLMNGQVKVGDVAEEESLAMAAEPEVKYGKK